MGQAGNINIFVLLAIRHNKNLKLKMFALKKLYQLLEINPTNALYLRFLKATILDINAGVVYNSNPNPNETEPPLMKKMVELVQRIVDVPLCIDSSVPEALKAGLETASGRPETP